jgi:hypothetical protein
VTAARQLETWPSSNQYSIKLSMPNGMERCNLNYISKDWIDWGFLARWILLEWLVNYKNLLAAW